MHKIIAAFIICFLPYSFAIARHLPFYSTNNSGQTQYVKVSNANALCLDEHSDWHESRNGENMHNFYTATTPLCNKDWWLIYVNPHHKSEDGAWTAREHLENCSKVEINIAGIPTVVCYE